ncbi:hypothetical protein [Pimelobacter sp. 30-1]|uniref:hypothetical protein n=1 Tax=Pimelobacter sp. 30-1 TaxID=2004991 RepID=UPI001C05B8D4|nr:hypothetical protein [Pimelobacter sp. 30-1]MBU2698791.1 hypothetical protein [Pimelobacter sp. 30-1]
MRTQLLGLTAAALAAGTLTAGLAGAPATAAGGIDSGNISTSGDVPESVDVVSTGPGDAVAAWVRPVPGGDKVYAAVATNGVWSSPKAVTATAVTDGNDVHVAANDKGDIAVVWSETILGDERVRGTRYLGNGTWDGSTPLNVQTDSVQATDVAMDAAGRVHVATATSTQGVDRVQTALWPRGGGPLFATIDDHAFAPSLAVNPAGTALLSYYSPNNGGDVMVTRRTPTTSWSTSVAVAWSGSVQQESEVGIADDGRGAVAFAGQDDGVYRASVAKVGGTGLPGAPSILSGPGASAAQRSLAVSPNGTTWATWSDFDGNDYLLRGALAKPDAGFGPAGIVDPDTASQARHVALVSDRGAQVVAHNGDDDLVLRYRTNPIHLFSGYPGGAADGPIAADMDREGNVVTVGVVENGLSSYVQADFLDLAGPSGTVTGPGPQVLAPSFAVTWSATDALAGVKTTDLLVRSAAWNAQALGTAQVGGNDLTGSATQFSGTRGSTYCFAVQSVDKLANLGLRSAERCTSVPLDDRALAGHGWSRAANAGHYDGTLSVTKKRGRVLKLKGVQARRLALVAGRSAKGGKVAVIWNGKVVRRISLKGKGAKVVLPIATFGSVQGGTLKIKVVSKTGRKIMIDGVVVAK